MKLTAEQAEDLPFPPGCPVWYTFTEKSSAGGALLKRGVVRSVSLDYHGEKDLIYEVVYNDGGSEKDKIVEEVSEHNLAYGANCPVTIQYPGDESAVEGTVLLGEPSPEDPRKFLYTVMTMTEGGSQARFASGIDANRIMYRKVRADSNAIPMEPTAIAAMDQKEEQSAHSTIKDDPPPPEKVSVIKDTGEEVSSSVTFDSFAEANKQNGKEEVAGSKSKRAHAMSGITSPPGATPKKNMRVDTALRENDGYRKSDCRRSPSSYYSRDRAITPEVHHDTRMDIRLPLWLQGQGQARRDLFFHLIGSKRDKRKGVSTIGRETNCLITVEFKPDLPLDVRQPPMIIKIIAHSTRTAPQDHFAAREKIKDLLLDYRDMRHDGSRGRLVYQIAACCQGAHNPNNSTSGAVSVNNPFTSHSVFMSVLDLPFTAYRGKKDFHSSYLLDSYVMDRVQSVDCYIKVCGVDDSYHIQTRYCDPHVLVFGRHWQNVDQAVDILKDAIRRHMNGCNCAFR